MGTTTLTTEETERGAQHGLLKGPGASVQQSPECTEVGPVTTAPGPSQEAQEDPAHLCNHSALCLRLSVMSSPTTGVCTPPGCTRCVLLAL